MCRIGIDGVFVLSDRAGLRDWGFQNQDLQDYGGFSGLRPVMGIFSWILTLLHLGYSACVV